MKKILVSIIFVCMSLCAIAQVDTYTTRIGEYKGPVKSVLATRDVGVSIDYYNQDGTIQKSVNSIKDHYTVFEWGDGTITQKFYKRDSDEFFGESVLGYQMDEESFAVGNESAVYMWVFADFAMYMVKDNKIAWCMKSTDRTPDGYTSIVFVDDKPYSKTSVKLFDPDSYGNFTRMVTTTSDGVEHEAILSYEYYEDAQ